MTLHLWRWQPTSFFFSTSSSLFLCAYFTYNAASWWILLLRVVDSSSYFRLETFLTAGLNGILWTKAFDICVDPGLNCPSKLQACGVSSTLVKDELADGCCKLVDGLDNNDIIISTLALRIFLKVNKALIDYQIIFFTKAQGLLFIHFWVQALIQGKTGSNLRKLILKNPK